MEEHIASDGWSMSPVVLVEQGRVAVADEVGQLLGARMTVMLIGGEIGQRRIAAGPAAEQADEADRLALFVQLQLVELDDFGLDVTGLRPHVLGHVVDDRGRGEHHRGRRVGQHRRRRGGRVAHSSA